MTEWTARGFVLFYLLAEALRLRSPNRVPQRAEVYASITAALVLAWHVAAAFGEVHHWSHAAALEHTARQTEQVTGWNSGSGLYVNYVFLALFAVDTVWRWQHARTATPVPAAYDIAIRLFFAFIVFNATVVFGPWFWTPVAMLYGAWLLTRFMGATQRV